MAGRSKADQYRKIIYNTKETSIDIEDYHGDILRYVKSHDDYAVQILTYLLEKGVKVNYAITITNILVNMTVYGVEYSKDVNTLIDVALEV